MLISFKCNLQFYPVINEILHLFLGGYLITQNPIKPLLFQNHLSRQKTEVNPDRKVIRRQVNNIQGAPPRTGDNNSRASEEHPPVSHTLNPGITTDAFRRRNSTKEVQKSGPAGEKGALFKLPTDGKCYFHWLKFSLYSPALGYSWYSNFLHSSTQIIYL